jgi:GNAT superfamily N-acetyltransferase
MSVVYHAFAPQEVGTTVIGLEKISNMEADIRPLHEQHYNETEVAYLDTPFAPDYERYKKSEEAGQFVVFTARHFGKMVGYLQYYVFRDMHSQGMYQGREDAFFVEKEHRGRGLAPALLRYAEHCLVQLGCSYVGMSSKAPSGGPDIGPFLERKGYRPVATYYVKQLESNENVLQRPAASA